MLRRAAFAVCLVALLAGCSSSEPTAPAASPSSSSSFTLLAPTPPPAPILTDTLHFLDAPHMAGSLAPGQQELRMPIPSNLPGPPPLQWSIPRPMGLDLVQAQVHLFVDVQGTLPNTGLTGCFWYVSLLVERDANSYYVDPMCASEGPVVQPGLHELTFSNTGFDLRNVAGETIMVQLSIDSIPPPGASATLVTGTVESDSTLTIKGLQLPIDTTTLL